MKKIFTIFIFLLFVGKYSFSQNHEKCGYNSLLNYYETLYPGYKQSVRETFENISQRSSANYYAETDVIQVVFHVVYNNDAQNLPDSVILRQLEILNEDYQRLNADTVNMRSIFNDVKANNSRIKFELAQTDPNGNPTTGILRVSTTRTTFADFTAALGDLSSIERVKDSQQGGSSPWDIERYLNIWICNMALPFVGPVILGYATPPADLPNWPGSIGDLIDGVVLQFQTVADNNPNTFTIPIEGRTATHEVGHYLGLRHIWGDENCGDDGIADTPTASAASSNDCNPNKNTCVDDINGVNLPDMIENYMDYSAETCQNSFTQGQVGLMKGVLANQRVLLSSRNRSLSIENIHRPMISPNPASDILNIKTKDNVLVNIYDLSGKLMLTEKTNNQILNIESIPVGFYIGETIDENNVKSSFRFVKK